MVLAPGLRLAVNLYASEILTKLFIFLVYLHARY